MQCGRLEQRHAGQHDRERLGPDIFEHRTNCI
jgi:hypothetical protein